MDGFLPYITGDGSVGLYSEEFNDIYHSGYGALTEAYEKFVCPLTVEKDNINVLDVCFGLGYNSKAFLNANKNKKITFDCLDINKSLMCLSPFLKTNHRLCDYFRKQKDNDKYSKYVRKGKYKKYRIDDFVNIVLIKNLYEAFGEEFFMEDVLTQNQFSPFFEQNLINFVKFLQKRGYKDIGSPSKWLFLHNIYYRYLSKRDILFNFYPDDARKTIQKLDKQYDFVFLDAFTTDKCPQLWSLDFLTRLNKLTSPTGVLVTYTNSVIIRNTLIESGYFVGKIINEDNKFVGTIASKDKIKIKNYLNEYELGLLKTKAGIPYRDFTLADSAEQILERRKSEVEQSNLMSSSRYIKLHSNKTKKRCSDNEL